MNSHRIILVITGIVEIAFGIWGILVSAGMWLIDVFIDDPNGILTGGWALAVLLLGFAAIVGGIFTIRREHWPVSLLGAVATVAPSLPFALLILPNFSVHKGFYPDTILAFLWILSVILAILTVRLKKSYRS